MNKKKITLLFLLILTGMVSNGQEMNFEENLKTEEADSGQCYTIGENYMLCPKHKQILVGTWFGTETKDCFGYFPDSTLKYDEVTMIIFGGQAFFDKSDLNIDWNTVELCLYRDHYFEFTDEKTLYSFSHGNISISNKTYDKNKHELNIEKRLKYRKDNELTEGFSVKGNSFYFKNTPILEPFDVPNLRTVVSKSGFETNYITDGKQVVFGGGKGGYSSTKDNGKEYVLAKRWMIEGVDLPSLCVLGRNLLADKNALYYCENVIPFAELKELKIIIREMD